MGVLLVFGEFCGRVFIWGSASLRFYVRGEGGRVFWFFFYWE